MDEILIREIIRDELKEILKIDKFVFDKHIQILDARNIQVGRTTGTSIGTEATQKLSFYGVTPVVQQGAITVPSGGLTVDAEARSSISDLITRIKNFGITL